jgi:hypothetical protein
MRWAFAAYSIAILIDGYDDRIADSFEGGRPFVLSPVTCPYAFEGYFSPVDNLPVRNGVQAGRAIPVKFSLGGDQGLDIFAAGYPTAQRIDCDTATALAPVEETVTAGASSLSYSSGTDQYHYVWKTEKAWAGTCQQLTIRLNDHSEHSANFQFR